MTTRTTASRTISIHDPQANSCLRLSDLRALIALADAEGYPDDSMVLTGPQRALIQHLTLREGS